MSSLEEFDPPKREKPLINYPHPYLSKQEEYSPIDTMARTNRAFKTSTSVGLILAAGLTALRDRRFPNLGSLKQSATTVFLFGAGGTGYTFLSSAFSNLREENDSLNHLYSGFLTGSFIGSVLSRKLVPSLWCGVGLGLSGFILHWSGGLIGKTEQSSTGKRLTGIHNNFTPKKSDVIEKQEFWEVARRRPLSQTLEELGEGAFKP